MRNNGKIKKKLYSVLASLSCMNVSASAYSNMANDSQLQYGLHNDSTDNILTIDSQKQTSENKNPSVDSLNIGEDSYQSNLKRQQEWKERLEKRSVSGAQNVQNSSSYLNSDDNGNSSGKAKYVFKEVIEPALAVVGAGAMLGFGHGLFQRVLDYRYNSNIRNYKRLLEISNNPGITNEYQCIMANASIPDSVYIINDLITCLNKNQQLSTMPLYKSTQIFKDDGSQKRIITFVENIKTPDTFLIQKEKGKLVLELSKKSLINDLKIYVKAKDVDIKLDGISDLKKDSNWGISIYKGNNLTLFLDVPKEKINIL